MKSILISRIQPARNAGKTVYRKKLIQKLTVNSGKTLIQITAPGGYGKTTLVQEFLFSTGSDYSWLNIHNDMDNFFVFMNYLVNSIKVKYKNFGNSIVPLLEENRLHLNRIKNPDGVINDICSLFFNELHKINNIFYIVLDDIGNIDSAPWLDKLMNSAAENIPANVTVILTSRTVPNFTLGRVNSKRGILKLVTSDLEFNDEETRFLLENLYDLSWNEADIHKFTLKLRGWITGMHLILQGSGSNNEISFNEKDLYAKDVYDYFTDDVFNNLPQNLKNFILYTSLAESFSVDLCGSLFNEIDCIEMINELTRRNLFLLISSSDVNSGEVNYIYHPLFKRFLNENIAASVDNSQIIEFIMKLIDYSLLKRNYSDAINYSIRSGDNVLAFRLIHENFQSFFNSGYFDVLWNWLEKLPIDVFSDDPQYLYYRALLLKFYHGKINEALTLLNRTIDISRQMKNYEMTAMCAVSKARILISYGKINEALDVLKDTDELDVNRSIRMRILYLTAYAHYNNSSYERALILLNRASVYLNEEILLSHGESNETKTDIYNLYGHIFLIRGEFIKSISYYEIVAKSSVKLTGKFETICNLVLLYSQAGRFEKANSLLKEAMEILERIPIPIIKVTFLLASQAFYYEFGDYKKSIELLKELNSLAFEMNHKYYIFLSYSLLGDCYYYLEDNLKAAEYYELADLYMNRQSELENIQSSVSQVLLSFSLTKNDKALKDKSEAILMNAYNFYKDSKMQHSLMQVMYFLAKFHLENNDLIRSLIYAGEAIDLSAAKEYHSFLQRELLKESSVLNLHDLNRDQKLFVKELKEQALRKQYAAFIDEEQKESAAAKALSISDITLKIFGRQEIVIGGNTVDESFWTKKKWRSMFIFLLLSPDAEVNKDRLLENFYRETSSESSGNLFHQFVSKIRNLFKTFTLSYNRLYISRFNNVPDQDEYIFKYENKTLKISSDLIISIDAKEFDKLIAAAKNEKDITLKTSLYTNAIRLYNGELLEGNYETWAEELRVKYKEKFIDACETAINLLNAEKNNEESELIAEKLLEHERSNLLANEVVIKKLIRTNRIKIATEKLHQLKKVYNEELNTGLPAEYIYRIENEFAGS